jgi:peptidoglycan hydrolase CwlO-like protein
MSTGDWFTLRPLNTTNYQPQIDDLNARLTSVQTRLVNLIDKVDGMEFIMNNMQHQIDS